MTARLLFTLGSLLGFIGVALGAFGVHGLKGKLAPEMLQVFEVGVRYQMYHALGLIAVAWLLTHTHQSLAVAAGWFMLIGILIFSGSLYTLALSGVKTWGAVTPLGGLLLMAGWIMLALAGWRGLS